MNMPQQPQPNEGQVNPMQPTDVERSQQEAPVQPTQPANGMEQPISPEKRQELKDMVKKLKDQIEYFNATKVASSQRTEIERKKALKEVFDKMTVAGVDLSNRESVAAFLTKINQNSPKLGKLFEQVIDSLMGPGDVPPDMGQDPQNNMNNINPNETLPETQ